MLIIFVMKSTHSCRKKYRDVARAGRICAVSLDSAWTSRQNEFASQATGLQIALLKRWDTHLHLRINFILFCSDFLNINTKVKYSVIFNPLSAPGRVYTSSACAMGAPTRRVYTSSKFRDFSRITTSWLRQKYQPIVWMDTLASWINVWRPQLVPKVAFLTDNWVRSRQGRASCVSKQKHGIGRRATGP